MMMMMKSIEGRCRGNCVVIGAAAKSWSDAQRFLH